MQKCRISYSFCTNSCYFFSLLAKIPLSCRRDLKVEVPGGFSPSGRSKKGRVLKNSAAVEGRVQRSNGDRSVGCLEHSNTCCTVCSSYLQHEQMFDVENPKRCL